MIEVTKMPRKKNLSTETLPMIPLRGVMVFPHMVLHFDVGRPRSVAALENAMMHDQRVFLVAQRDVETERPTRTDLYVTGTVAVIKQVLNLPGDNLRVLAEGTTRAELASIESLEDRDNAVINYPAPLPCDENEKVALTRTVRDLFEKYSRSSMRFSAETARSVLSVEDPDKLADVIAANMLNDLEDRQEILDEPGVCERLEKLGRILTRECELSEVENRVQARVKVALDKNQKDYYLREQIHAIQEELGDTDENQTDELTERLQKTPLNDEARGKVEKELKHLASMAPGNPEITVSRNWIEWVLDLPWGKYTQDMPDISRARRILDEDHYGMKQVKERVIEYLAVMGMKKKTTGSDAINGPILCFVGPPGVGKTSIVKSVARALGRKFVQMSLGGIRDEAEIRGHRRTYVGAIPGRIISGMKQASAMNPVFLFDEIDKMSSDFRGDPASAMLEVLDGEQNGAFRDHYLDLPFDLSRVLFITTANSMDTIPGPLLDRMEIIEVPGYTEEEKLQIAMRHLLKKQVKELGLPAGSIRIKETVMRRLIEDYTRESGVRTLSRTISKAVRKAAVDMMETEKKSIGINEETLTRYLGAPRYIRELPEKEPQVGIVNGLAYTVVGGETLTVECTCMPGSGQMQLTGQLGDVMKESGQAALSWVRAHSAEYGLNEDFYKTRDIHIHVPEGAVPKDGPSAGVTMITSLVSALTGIPVRQDVAMTGEITLRGRVLPIGGLKEKLLAAYRAGIRMVLIPEENKKDLEEIPEHVLSCMQIRAVSRIGDVLSAALVRGESEIK